MGQQEREAVAAVIHVFADLMGQLEEQPSQARGHGLSQRDAAGILQREAVFLADALDGAHLRLLVAAQEAEEPVALDGAELGAGQRLGGDLVDAVGENRIQAQHGAGSGDADDHLAIFLASGGEFEIAATDEIETAGILTLGKERGLGGKGDGAGGQFKIGQDGAAQRTEPAGAAIATGSAARRNRLCGVLFPRMDFC